MADIAKCAGIGCKIKEKCYRYTAPENDRWQTYARFEENLAKDGSGCPNYWDNSKS